MSTVQTLYGRSTTKHGDKKTVTEKDPKYIKRTEQEINGFNHPDPDVRAAAQAEYEAQKNAAATAYGVSPETGKVDPKYITDILGVDPAVMRQKREEEQELNRRKQKESALYNALSVLGDMVTTAGGGNVWQRQPDQHAKAAHEANMALDREQQAEDIANAGKIRATEQAYAAAVQKIHDNVGKAYKTKISNSQETGGKTTATTTQGNDVTKSSRQVLDRTGDGASSSSSSGSGNGGYKIVKVQLKNGQTADIKMPAGQYDATGRYLSALYNALDASGNDNISKLLSESGIEPQETGKGKYTYDGADLLSSGIVFENPKIRQEFIKAINADASITPEEKRLIIKDMQTYPTVAPQEQKESWWRRLWNKWFGNESAGNDAPWVIKGNSNNAPWVQG